MFPDGSTFSLLQSSDANAKALPSSPPRSPPRPSSSSSSSGISRNESESLAFIRPADQQISNRYTNNDNNELHDKKISLSSKISLLDAEKRRAVKLNQIEDYNNNNAVDTDISNNIKKSSFPSPGSDFEFESSSSSKPESPFDFERITRKNRRKLELLELIDDNLNGFSGHDDDPLTGDLFDQIQTVSSRPSSTGSSRPGTIQGDSRLMISMCRQLTPRRPGSAILARSAATGILSNNLFAPRDREVINKQGIPSLPDKGYINYNNRNRFLSKDAEKSSDYGLQRSNNPSTSSLISVDYSEFGL